MAYAAIRLDGPALRGHALGMDSTPVQTPNQELEWLVQTIVDEVDPLEVILFGSTARGQDRPDSDFDLLVVMPDGTRRRPTEGRLYRAVGRLPGRTRGADILVATPALLDHERGAWWSVFDTAPNEGVTVYRRTEGLGG